MGAKKVDASKNKFFQNWNEIDIIFFRSWIMGILCHYDEITVVPFLDFRIPLQRIRRTKANGMFPVLENSKTILVIEDSHIVCNHILTSFHYEEFL